MFAITTEALFSETSATITESCSIDPSATVALCTQTIQASGYGQANAVTTAFNLTGNNYHQYQVAITAGTKKLSGSDQCKAVQGGAASTTPSSVLMIGAGLLAGVGAVLML